MGEAADSVWAMVCGLPRGRREHRLLMVLQAYFDDSKTDGEVLVLGGYVAPAKQWAVFADEWKDVLSIRPPWRRFKASEVCASNDTVTQERVRHHYKVIRDHVLADVCVAIPLPAFRSVCAEFGMTGAHANPYFFAWGSIISLLAHNASRLGINEPVELYFDMQSEKTKILSSWDYYKQQMPRRWRQIIKNMPAFRDDDEVMPLQAADFAAWQFRKAFLESGEFKPEPILNIVPWETDPRAFAHLYAYAHSEGMRIMARKIRDLARFRLTSRFSLPGYGIPFLRVSE